MAQLFSSLFQCKKLIVLASLIISGFTFGQEAAARKVYEWTTFFENDFVRIEYKYGDCHIPSFGLHQERVYLQFTNKTSDNLSVSWDLELKYGARCYNCDGTNAELKFELNLVPNQTVAGECQEKHDSKLVIFSKHLDFESSTPPLSSFQLNNLAYKKL